MTSNSESTPLNGAAAPSDSPPNHHGDRLLRDAAPQANCRLQLADARTGTRVTLALDRPYLIVGSQPGSDVRLMGGSLRHRHAALLWNSGRLFAVDLAAASNEAADLVRCWSPNHEERWGTWQVAVDGLPNVEEPADVASWRLELTWGQTGPAQPTLLDQPVTLIGSAAGCGIRIADADLAPVQAALLRMRHAVWVIALDGGRTTRINGRAVDYGPLDPGDSLGVGDQIAWLTARWLDDGRTHHAPGANGSRGEREQLQEFLLGQSARLTQMQQRLVDLLEQQPDGDEHVLQSLEQFRQLAAECEDHASRLMRPAVTEATPKSARS